MSFVTLAHQYWDEILVRYHRSDFRIREHFRNFTENTHREAYLVCFLECPLDYEFVVFGFEAENGKITRYYAETEYRNHTRTVEPISVSKNDKEYIEELYKKYIRNKENYL